MSTSSSNQRPSYQVGGAKVSRVSGVASSGFEDGPGECVCVCVSVSQRNQSTCTYICVMAGRTGQYHRNHACFLLSGTSGNMSFSSRTCWLSSRSRGAGAVGAPLHHSPLQPDHRGRAAARWATEAARVHLDAEANLLSFPDVTSTNSDTDNKHQATVGAHAPADTRTNPGSGSWTGTSTSN